MAKKSKMSALLLADYEKKKNELAKGDDKSSLPKLPAPAPKEVKTGKEDIDSSGKKDSEKEAEKAKDDSAKEKELSKTEKLKKSVQKRIDELVAKNKQKDVQIQKLEEKIQNLLSSETKDAAEDDISLSYKNALSELAALRKKQISAEEGQVDALIVEEMELLEKLRDFKLRILESKNAKDAEVQKKTALAHAANWSKGIKRAVDAFPVIFSTEKDRFNTENALYKKALEILTSDGKKPVYNIALAKSGFVLNPRFDHGDGFYAAVLEAANELNLKSEKNEADLAHKENQKLKAKEQLLSGGIYPQALSGKAKGDAEILALRDKMFDEGADSPAGMEYYRRIRSRVK